MGMPALPAVRGVPCVWTGVSWLYSRWWLDGLRPGTPGPPGIHPPRSRRAPALVAQTTGAPAAAPLLDRAAAYLTLYERAVSAIVASEDYRQTVIADPFVAGASSRTLRSDLLVLDEGDAGWVSFRDVYEVDGSPVRNHDERLAGLLAHFVPGSIREARRIAAESARDNVNPTGVVIDRTINTPITALLFLRAANQSRSTFTRGRTDDVDGVRAVTLHLSEQDTSRLIGSRDNAAAHGAFWIDPETGRVLKSELDMESGGQDAPFVSSHIAVTYANVPAIGLWMPVSMDESYDIPAARQALRGHAVYSHFRQFNVTVDSSAQ